MNPYLFAAAKPWNETMKRDDGTRTEKKATAGATRLVTARCREYIQHRNKRHVLCKLHSTRINSLYRRRIHSEDASGVA
jgi:hypothetical protein